MAKSKHRFIKAGLRHSAKVFSVYLPEQIVNVLQEMVANTDHTRNAIMTDLLIEALFLRLENRSLYEENPETVKFRNFLRHSEADNFVDAFNHYKYWREKELRGYEKHGKRKLPRNAVKRRILGKDLFDDTES